MPNAAKASQDLTGFVSNAPPDLVEIYKKKTITYGRKEILEKLLAPTADMRRVWKELENQNPPFDHAVTLFKVVRELADPRKAKEPKPHDVEKHYRDIARHAAALARLIQDSNTDPGVMLDLQVFEYASAETMAAYGINCWDTMHFEERQLAGWAVLGYWPRTSEILKSLAERAKASAVLHATDSRAVKKVLNPEKQRTRYFVMRLAQHMQDTYGKQLYGTVASIASAILPTALNKNDVKNMRQKSDRGQKRGVEKPGI